MCSYLKLPGQPVLPKYVQVKYADDGLSWREVEDPYLDYNLHSSHKVIQVVDTINDEVSYYPSLISCARAVGVKKSALRWRLDTKGQHVYKDGCKYGYYPYEY
jgi:hypothetical protein